jgi:N-acetylglucosaminyldiphosphoundecaprenol N-acetyl-beta-D-mannosaminyltransferase
MPIDAASADAVVPVSGLGLQPTVFVDRQPTPPRRHFAPLPLVELRGVPFHAVTEARAIEYVLAELDRGHGGWAITPNLDHLRRLTGDRKLRTLYETASLILADGMPLIWASRLQGTPLPERVAGSTLITTLSDAAAKRNRSVFLLGGDAGTADAASEVLRNRSPGLRVAGTLCPPMGFENDDMEMSRLISAVTAADPDIIYVALGSPKQEWLIGRLRGYLPRAWWLGIGISFSFLCGRVRRAPAWMQKCGLEWAHRLAQEPKRLARRYLLEGIPFGVSLLAHCAGRRATKRNQVRQRRAIALEAVPKAP